MVDTPLPMVPVNLPADLLAKIEELKQDREDDRKQSVEQIVQRLCRDYVTVREKARWEQAHMEEINKSYQDHPNDWEEAESWEPKRSKRPRAKRN
jgi:hypothetical protein